MDIVTENVMYQHALHVAFVVSPQTMHNENEKVAFKRIAYDDYFIEFMSINRYDNGIPSHRIFVYPAGTVVDINEVDDIQYIMEYIDIDATKEVWEELDRLVNITFVEKLKFWFKNNFKK